MINILRCLGALWVLPVALPIWLLYLLPAVALGWLKIRRRERFLVVRFEVTGSDGWYVDRWARWGGQALPFAVLINPVRSSPTLTLHELRHTDQWLLFGPLFFPLWALFNVTHTYRRNPFEVDASRWASKIASGRR